MTIPTAPRTATSDLLEAIDRLESVSVGWAPGHTAPFVSKYLVLPIVDAYIARVRREAIEPLLALVRAAQDMATLNAERTYFVVPESVPQRLRAALDALPADILAAAEKP